MNTDDAKTEHLGASLSAYIDGESGPSERSHILRHLDSCHACRVELNDLSMARAAVRGLPIVEMPGGLTLNLAAPIELEVRRTRSVWLPAAAAAATAAVLFAGGVALTDRTPPLSLTPHDLAAPYLARASAEVGLVPIKALVPPVPGPEATP